MRKIKNKYEILVIIRKVKMTKRMLKSKLIDGIDAMVNELIVQR